MESSSYTNITFCLAESFTFSVDHRQFRTLQQNCFTKHANVIMCNLFFKLFIGHRPKPELTTNCQQLPQLLLWLISCLSLWPSHCVHPFQAASFFCKHTDTSYALILNLKPSAVPSLKNNDNKKNTYQWISNVSNLSMIQMWGSHLYTGNITLHILIL